MNESAMPMRTPEVERIGQVPNMLAAAHYLATSPRFTESAVFRLDQSSAKVIVVVVEEPSARAALARDIAVFAPERKVLSVTGSPLELLEIQRMLGRDSSNSEAAPIILVDSFTVDGLALPPPSTFEKKVLRVAVNDELPQQSLKEFLVTAGYDPDKTANLPGVWASRGSIVDVYTESPHRIEFDGNTIASIIQFDLATGAAVGSVDSLLIAPLTLRGRSTIFDYLPEESTVLLSMHMDPLPAIAERTNQIIVEPVQVPGGAHATNAGYVEPHAYHRRFQRIQDDLRAHTHRFVFTDQPETVEGITQEVSEMQIHHVPTASRGFIHAESGTIALTDKSIGLSEERRQKQQAKAQEAMIQELKPGEHVVHLFHGIARFSKMEVMHINGMDREYFVLEFAGNDKIYVPVELAERLDKYVGDDQPKLHSLGGASWMEAVAKVKASTLEMARELLNLYARRSTAKAPQLAEHDEEKAFDAAFPHDLTADQVQALKDIFADMATEEPMDRLLCGDVGFGKTEVAMRAAFRAVLGGYQVGLLAPTTVLAQQHYDNFEERMREFGVHVVNLSRLQSKQEQKVALEGMAAGNVDIVIGTHRLLSKDVRFKRLGLIIIDEEQRFGVKAKETLKKLRTTVHALAMTATPIPRTLHLSVTGLRDISTILTPPAARKSVRTIIQPYDAKMITEAIQRELAREGQVYYIYNRVRSIEMVRERVQQMAPSARIAIAHGQMAPQALADVMHQFDTGKIDILLATSIVENGLDVSRANTLIVEKASMFGLSELYQLKGRVGRGERQGYAYFTYNEASLQGDVRKRFIALQEAEALGSGFELAMKDMEIRGVGNLLGKQQHGQAVKIGLNLYLRLLQQAIRELEGQEDVEPERDIPIDLPVEARIPENVLPGQGDRILLYQQLANIRDRARLLEKREEFSRQERFGGTSLPKELAGLFDVLEVKLLAARTPLLEINTDYPNKVNKLTGPRITLVSEQLFDFETLPPGTIQEWEDVFNRSGEAHKMRALLSDLGENWMEKLKHLLLNLQRERLATDTDVENSSVSDLDIEKE